MEFKNQGLFKTRIARQPKSSWRKQPPTDGHISQYPLNQPGVDHKSRIQSSAKRHCNSQEINPRSLSRPSNYTVWEGVAANIVKKFDRSSIRFKVDKPIDAVLSKNALRRHRNKHERTKKARMTKRTSKRSSKPVNTSFGSKRHSEYSYKLGSEKGPKFVKKQVYNNLQKGIFNPKNRGSRISRSREKVVSSKKIQKSKKTNNLYQSLKPDVFENEKRKATMYFGNSNLIKTAQQSLNTTPKYTCIPNYFKGQKSLDPLSQKQVVTSSRQRSQKMSLNLKPNYIVPSIQSSLVFEERDSIYMIKDKGLSTIEFKSLTKEDVNHLRSPSISKKDVKQTKKKKQRVYTAFKSGEVSQRVLRNEESGMRSGRGPPSNDLGLDSVFNQMQGLVKRKNGQILELQLENQVLRQRLQHLEFLVSGKMGQLYCQQRSNLDIKRVNSKWPILKMADQIYFG